MKLFAGLLISATMFAAPAWAEEPQVDFSDFAVSESTSAPIDWFGNYVVKTEELENKYLLTSPTTEKDEFGIKWSGNGRWGLTLDVIRRKGDEVRVLPEEEISAGAYFQFSPRFRLGGGISIGGEKLSSDASRWADEENETNVRIESAFSF